MKSDTKVPQALLEQLALGELDAERERRIRERLEKEDGGKKRLENLIKSNERILDEYAPAQMAARIRLESEQRTAGAAPGRGLRIAIPAVATAAVAFIALLMILPARDAVRSPGAGSGIESGADTIRIKGNPMLRIYKKREDGAGEVKRGDTAVAGDVLQLSYNAAGRRYGVILSVDGRGAVTLHHPQSESASTMLDAAGSHSLPFAYELDDAPGFERFFFITSDKPIDPGAVMNAARELGPDDKDALDLPASMRQTDFVLKKEE